MSAQSPFIQIKSVSRVFNGGNGVHDLTIDIPRGSFVVLLGPSGCGKSTTLRLIAGLETADQGTIAIDGKDVTNMPPSRRGLSMVFQSYALFPHLSVAENIIFGLKVRKTGKEEIRTRLDDALSVTGLAGYEDRKPAELSGGQRQRVALARAIVAGHPLCLMDEPLSNLDAALRVHMRSELAELHHSLKTTFIYVTHDQAEALTMSDRMAVMMEGDILQLGAPDEIYRDPADRRVAEFIGSPRVNMLDGEADAEGRVTAHGIPLKRSLGGAHKRLSIGVRPEHLDVLVEGGAAGAWPFRISHKENLGSDCFLHGHVTDGGQRVIARAAPELAAALSIGADIHVRPKPGTAMAFGADHRRLRFREA